MTFHVCWFVFEKQHFGMKFRLNGEDYAVYISKICDPLSVSFLAIPVWMSMDGNLFGVL